MKHINKFKNFNKLYEEHTEQSEKIYFDYLKTHGIEEMINIASEAFNDIGGSSRIREAENDADLWNALDFLNLFDEFANILERY